MAVRQQRMDAELVPAKFAAVDAMISLLEEHNLGRDRALTRALRERLRRLETAVGRPLPRTALRARNSARLHAVLLDWRETLQDVLRPDRLNFLDAPDDDDDVAQEM